MEKVSVIIPTIQKNLKVLEKLLNILEADQAVDEILIINNIKKPLEYSFSKVKIHNPDENLYVNGSWNYGIKNIKNDYFLIINDDILCCEYFCTIIIATEILKEENTGLVGIDINYINQHDRTETDDINIPVIDEDAHLSFTPVNKYLQMGDWGSAIFGKKENYFQIPQDLKIIYGDNYILQENIKNKKQNYAVSGLPFNHIHSLSSASPEFSEITKQDGENFTSKYLDLFCLFGKNLKITVIDEKDYKNNSQ